MCRKSSSDPRPGETICSGCSGGKIKVEKESSANKYKVSCIPVGEEEPTQLKCNDDTSTTKKDSGEVTDKPTKGTTTKSTTATISGKYLFKMDIYKTNKLI